MRLPTQPCGAVVVRTQMRSNGPAGFEHTFQSGTECSVAHLVHFVGIRRVLAESGSVNRAIRFAGTTGLAASKFGMAFTFPRFSEGRFGRTLRRGSAGRQQAQQANLSLWAMALA